jgi:Trypsin-like peptidase domain
MKVVSGFGVSVVLGCGLACSVQAQASVVNGNGFVSDMGTVQSSDTGLVVEEASIREIEKQIDSGSVQMTSDSAIGLRAPHVSAWETVVDAPNADWVRVRFGEVILAHSTERVRESYLRITSLEDGYEQYLDIDSLREWNNTTAYFNGGAVRVELMVSPNASGQINRVEVVGVQASKPSTTDRSICFGVDDRELSFDDRDARLMPIGCTAWLFGDQGSCMLTAAHCGPGTGDVIQFNVPLSSNGGSPQNPPPQDQYPVDGSSVQQSGSIFIGNDWAYFGVFDNSNTDMTPMEAQGASHTLSATNPPADGRPIRITGYGSTVSPVPPSWYLVQKTHVGPLISNSGNIVRYQTDTSGGNSGGVVLDENNNVAIGIHTNAGCNSTGGSNQATSLFNSGLQAALANPQGICVPRSIRASVLFLPTHIDPNGGDVATLLINDLNDHEIVGTPMMFIDSGSGFVGSEMVSSGADSYEGMFSSYACGTPVSYYFTIEDEEGTVVSVPSSGSYSTVALDDLSVALVDDFESDTGWISFTTGGSGSFTRATPGNFGAGDPVVDADGSGLCFVTGNSSGVDVDNGGVAVLSPVIDVSGVEDPTVRVALWMVGSAGDSMKVEFSSNSGSSWSTVDTVVNTDGWEEMEYAIEDHVSSNSSFRVRISVSDGGSDSLVEGGVDAFRISREFCEDNVCAADFNGDGDLNFFDVSAFLDAFGMMDSGSDFDGNGEFNFFDISAFLKDFGAGCP